MTARKPRAIAAEREAAAAELEREARLLALAFQRFQRLGDELRAALDRNLAGYSIEAQLSMIMNEAGLGSLLERKLIGKSLPLAAIVAEQHRKLLDTETA